MPTTVTTPSLLAKLQLEDVNQGASAGADRWISAPGAQELVSYNPTTGEPIARVLQASAEAYDEVVADAVAAFESWRMTPAPKRGELVRDLGNALRELKEPLGDLVSLEMGKIRAEGHGEVQEMIDICDFAVRPLAPALRPDDRLGAAGPPDDGAVAPARAGGRDHRLQLPGRGLVVERGDRRGLRRPGGVEARRADAALRGRRAAHRQPRDGRPRRARRVHAGDRAGRAVGERMLDDRAAAADLVHRLDAGRPSTSRRRWPDASAGRSSSSAATTPSSSPRTRTSISRRARSSSAPSAPPASAAPRRGASSCTKSIAGELIERLVRAYGQVRDRRSARAVAR